LIQFVKDVGRRLGVGGTPQEQSPQAPAAQARPDPDAQKASALVQLVEQMGFTVEDLGIRV
jgi:hypothetical protein